MLERIPLRQQFLKVVKLGSWPRSLMLHSAKSATTIHTYRLDKTLNRPSSARESFNRRLAEAKIILILIRMREISAGKTTF